MKGALRPSEAEAIIVQLQSGRVRADFSAFSQSNMPSKRRMFRQSEDILVPLKPMNGREAVDEMDKTPSTMPRRQLFEMRLKGC